MQDQLHQIEYVEPITHKENLTIPQQLFGQCMDDQYSLNKQEIIEWWNLRTEVAPLYDYNDLNCIKRFKSLWYILTDTDFLDENLKHEKWTEFGFQQANPVTDLRGGGVQALDDIINFSTKNKDVIAKMCDPINDYYYAASSINVTFFMKKYFHVQEDLHYKKDRQVVQLIYNEVFCSRIAMKNFCRFLVYDDNIWSRIHEMLLRDLFLNCWLGLRKERSNVTIMDYGIALERMQAKCKESFTRILYLSFKELQQYYQSLE